MAYVVRDHRAAAQWGCGLLASAAVVVAVCAASGRWWVAAVGVPLSLLVVGRRVRTETSPVRADRDGISVAGRWTGWQAVDEVTVTRQGVLVTLADGAPLPGWARSRVRHPGVTAGDRVRLAVGVRADPEALASGIRAQAPAAVRVSAA
jgi:hypothetical protein